MSDTAFFMRRCDRRIFYGKPKPDGNFSSFRCSSSLTAHSAAELELKSQNAGWMKANIGDICYKCVKKKKEKMEQEHGGG
jgi:hypothetical protein